MSQVINTNMSSLNAQRALNSVQGSQQTAMERLSSGKRINSAADDAAGLAIAENMTAQIKGTNMAIRNSNDGISYVQTTEGALDEISNLLQRMRELKVQDENGTLTTDQSGYIDTEFAALGDEIDNILQKTEFNDTTVLISGTITIQTGWEDSDTMTVGMASLDTSQLGAAADGPAASAMTLANIDTALDQVNTARATLGSQQNRLEHNISNLANVAENMAAAKSQIMDADFAAESAELARTNVLQQAGMAMLAQANQAPNNILALVK